MEKEEEIKKEKERETKNGGIRRKDKEMEKGEEIKKEKE